MIPYAPIIAALGELGSSDIGKGITGIAGNVLINEISKRTGIDLSDPNNKQNAEEAAKRLLDDRKGFREFKLELRRIQQAVELREIESNQAIMTQKLSLHQAAIQSDDRRVRNTRPLSVRLAWFFIGCLILTFIGILLFEIRFQNYWFEQCMESDHRAECFEFMGKRVSFVATFIQAMGSIGMTALIAGVVMPISFYFQSRRAEKLHNKDDSNLLSDAGKVRMISDDRGVLPEKAPSVVDRALTTIAPVRERVLPREMPEGAYKGEPLLPVKR